MTILMFLFIATFPVAAFYSLRLVIYGTKHTLDRPERALACICGGIFIIAMISSLSVEVVRRGTNELQQRLVVWDR